MLPSAKEKALKTLGAEKTVFLDFGKIKDIEAQDFLEIICRKYSPHLILCGFNFKFGKGAKGDKVLLKSFCDVKGIDFKACEPICEDNLPISSTNLRNLIKVGKIDLANKQIYGGFGFTSEVLHGDQRGRTIGFPTVNQKFPDMLVKPKFGVYSSKIIIDGQEYEGITNLGVRPTFLTEEVYCETYILNFSRDIYGKEVELKLLKFIREEKKFADINELKSAIKEDISKI